MTLFLIGSGTGLTLAAAIYACVRFGPRCGFEWNHNGSFGPHECRRVRGHLGKHRCSDGATTDKGERR